MPALTTCTFENWQFTGAADCISVEHSRDGWAWTSQTFSDREACGVRERIDEEIVIPLTGMLDNPENREIIDDNLPDEATRISGIRGGMVPFRVLNYFEDHPDRHPPHHLMTDLNFRVRIDLPRICHPGGEATATIHYIINVFLDDSGRPHLVVDGWEWQDQGTGVCDRRVNRAMRDNIPGGVSDIRSEFERIESLLEHVHFRGIYYLPGDGRRSGSQHIENVRNDASLILIP